MSIKKVAVIGGGAAGFFFAINYKSFHPEDEVIIYEQSKNTLNKVRISGGGRCNVTHACWEPSELIAYYPRGGKELLGPFHRFACGDTVEWFESREVPLKIEEDGRMFPVSNRSESIIGCFMNEIAKYGIIVNKHSRVEIKSLKERSLILNKEEIIKPDIVFLATGSSKYIWQALKANGVKIVDPVPSLFTFNINDVRLRGLAGISFRNVDVKSEFEKYHSSGPLLITHWGLSAPSVLKLSSVEAREMADARYKFKIEVDFLPHLTSQDVHTTIKELRGKKVGEKNPFGIPKRYWRRLIQVCKMDDDWRWADLKKDKIETLVDQLKNSNFTVKGKSTFKEEFVSAGGIDLKEIDFRDFKIKQFEGVYAAGEVLNIDAMTGGFNFQAAWTGSYIAASKATS